MAAAAGGGPRFFAVAASHAAGWKPNYESPLLATVLATHKQLFEDASRTKSPLPPPQVYSVHAGLECGPIMLRYPTLHCVSIGPLVVGAHTPDEKLNVETVGPFYAWLRETVQNLARVPADKF